jgi:hypothetical protein
MLETKKVSNQQGIIKIKPSTTIEEVSLKEIVI